MRDGDFTIDGAIAFDVTATAEANYLFDSTARTAVGNADFVRVYVLGETTATLNTTTVSARFDVQGDGGSGTMLATGVGTSTAKNVVWAIGRGRILNLPASLFGTTDTTRTGRLTVSTADTEVIFQFCSWNPSSNP